MNIEKLSNSLNELKNNADNFFNSTQLIYTSTSDDARVNFLNALPNEYQKESQNLQKELLRVISLIIPLLENSIILGGADKKDISECTKKMLAALKFSYLEINDIEVLYDEDRALGINPPCQNEGLCDPSVAKETFSKSSEKLDTIVQLLKATPSNISNGLPSENPNLPQNYSPLTAFIMMPIGEKYNYTYDKYKECFLKFGIEAVRADDIEHNDIITYEIKEKIRTSEFLLGDLTDRRPNVYYEIGYAHALERRVIIYRSKDTKIDFDLAGYNCKEYKDMRELKKLLLKRLEVMTNKKPSE